MNLISYIFRESWKLSVLAIIAGLIGGASAGAIAKVMSETIQGTGNATTAGRYFFGFCLLLFTSKSCSEIMLLGVTQTAIVRLRIELSRRLLATPFAKLQSLGKSKLLVILTKDVDTFIQAYQLIPMVLGSVITILACAGYMAWLSWQLFLMFLVVLIVGLSLYAIAERGPKQQMAKLRDQMDVLYRHFRSLIDGTRELQLNARRGSVFIDKVIATNVLLARRILVGTMTSYTWIANFGSLFFYLVIGALLFLVPHSLVDHPETLTTFTLIVFFLVRPITDLIMALPSLRQATISLQKIQQLENQLQGEQVSVDEINTFATTAPLSLDLKGVSYNYLGATGDAGFSFGPIDLSIKQGEILFIVGGNGSGKTTLAMLLLGFYSLSTGQILLNNIPVTKINLKTYRQYFSAVFSDFHLFEHLLSSDPEQLNAHALHYIKQLGMADKVTVVDDKFSTLDLSSGQRKRLALVSSYLEDRPIYLFDEWAADQDPAFKRVFYQEILPDLKTRGKTVIIITHDDSYFSCADRVVKLDSGAVSAALVA